MYCPDDVITKLYSFLKTVEASSSTDDQMKKALGEVMLAIRTDLLKGSEIKSNLTPGEFKMYSLKKDKKQH